MMALVWRESARQELRQIFSYIADRDLAAAERLGAAIEACAERWPEHPFLYRPGRAPETREAVAHPNYILIYRVGTDAVEIVSVVHARQQYP
jgi:plasmid stabilization system protein ParE